MATMDQADIRGLVTDISSVRRGAAYSLVVGDHSAMDAHITFTEDSPHRGLRIALLLRCSM